MQLLRLNKEPAPLPTASSPFVGLTPYTEEQAPYFFGRERERTLIIANLMASRLTLFYGPSGVGKSSVLQAGVVSHLNELSAKQIGRDRVVKHVVALYNSWSEDPVAGLRKVVHAAVSRSFNGRSIKPLDERKSLKETLDDLTSPLLDQPSAKLTILIILDQFEEFFLYPQNQNERSFADELPEILNQKKLAVNFLLSLREDYLASLDRFKGHISYLFDNSLRIRHLNKKAAADAIKEPIKKYNLEFGTEKEIEAELVEAVLDEVKINKVSLGDSGKGVVPTQAKDASDGALIETPYLQLVMSRLWEQERFFQSDVLRLSTLRKLDGARNIVKTHVDAVMKQLSVEEQEVASGIFHYLVTPSATKIAYLPYDLAKLAGLQEANLTEVLKRLSGDGVRLLTTVEPPPDRPNEPRYEIRHDALAPAILDWRTRFMQKKEAKANVEKLESERTRVRNLRFVLAGVLLLLAVMISLMLYAYSLRSEAQKQQSIAFSRELAAHSVSKGIDPELALLLAQEALNSAPTVQGDEALRSSLVRFNLERLLKGHVESINSVEFGPDGKSLLTASGDGKARVWDLTTDKYVELKDHTNGIWNARFSKNGKLIVTASEDQTAIVWDATGKKVSVLKPHQDRVNDAAFSPDGTQVATASLDGYLRIWDPLTGSLIRSMVEGPDYLGRDHNVNGISYSPNGKLIVTSSRDDFGRVWDAQTGALKHKLAHEQNSVVYIAAFSLDSRYIVTGSQDGRARVWDAESGRRLTELAHGGSVYDATFSPDGNLVATASKDGLAHIWNWSAPTALPVILKGHNRDTRDGVHRVAFSPDGKLVLTGGDDGVAIIWDANSGQIIAELKGHKNFIQAIAFSRDGRYVSTGSGDSDARVWRIPIDSDFRTLLTGSLDSVRYSPNGRYIATAAYESGVQIWDTYTSRKITDISSAGFKNPSFTPQGDLVLGIEPEEVVVLNPFTGAMITSLRSRTAQAALFSPNRNYVVVTQESGIVRLWETSGTATKTLVGHSKDELVWCAAFSPDSKYVATGSGDNTARIWEVSSGNNTAVLTGHKGAVVSIAFSADGKYLVTASDDSSARVWDPTTGKTLAELTGHTAGVRKIDISNDSKFLLTTSLDGSVRIWDLASGKNLVMLEKAEKGITSAVFSPDGRIIVTTGEGNYARAWEWNSPERSKQPAILTGPQSVTTDARFSPDGNFVIVASGDGARIYPWEKFAPIEDLLQVVKRRVTRELSSAERKEYLHEQN